MFASNGKHPDLSDVIAKKYGEYYNLPAIQSALNIKTIGDYKSVTLVSLKQDPDVKFFADEHVVADEVTESIVKLGGLAFEGYLAILKSIIKDGVGTDVYGNPVRIRSLIKRLRKYKVYPVFIVDIKKEGNNEYAGVRVGFVHVPNLRQLTKTVKDGNTPFWNTVPIIWDRFIAETSFLMPSKANKPVVVNNFNTPQEIVALVGDKKTAKEVVILIKDFMHVLVTMLARDPRRMGVKSWFFNSMSAEFTRNFDYGGVVLKP